MPVSRILFDITTDTGGVAIAGDTGGPVYGEIVGIYVKPHVLDTGGDLEMGLYPDADDTGMGYLFYNNDDCLGAPIRFAPVIPGVHNPDGSQDTGSNVPLVAGGERMIVRIRAGRVVAAGGTNRTRIWVYVRD